MSDQYCTGCDTWKTRASFAEHSSRCRECKSAADRQRNADKRAGKYTPKPRGPRGPYLTAARRADRENEELAIGLEDARRAVAELFARGPVERPDSGGFVFDAEQIYELFGGIPAPSGDVLTLQCESCGRTRVFDDFRRDPRRVSGRSRECRDCRDASL